MDTAFCLSLVVSEPEQQHLKNLAQGRTKNYRGNHRLRGELRNLRGRGMVRSLPNRPVEDMKNGSSFDLAKFVELTDLGRNVLDLLSKKESRQ